MKFTNVNYEYLAEDKSLSEISEVKKIMQVFIASISKTKKIR